jgi:Polysaccharide lyase
MRFAKRWIATAIVACVPAGLTHAGEVQFFCSFETSPTDCGFHEQAKVKGRATLVDIARHGSRAVRLHTEPGDSNVSGSGIRERNDLRLSQTATDCYEGREQWWAHSVLFPADYRKPGPGESGLIADFHHTGPTGQANFNLSARPDGLHMIGAGGPTVATNTRSPGVYKAFIGPIVQNVWYDFVYHVKWSSGPDGFFHAWVNGAKTLAHRGPTLYSGMGCYLKLANYHSPTGYPNSVIHDRVVRGASASAVAINRP